MPIRAGYGEVIHPVVTRISCFRHTDFRNAAA
nr:MAG TPA: hypothetical protein [Caudoviricetes sp.]